MLPKDDQEMEELMLEEVQVFKVGVAPACPCPRPSVPAPDLRAPGRAREASEPQADPSLLPGPGAR